MKTKQKLVLSLAALSAITLGVGATSTFAWFTTQRVASAKLTHTTVQATEGNLLIKYVSSGTNGGVTDTVTGDSTYHTGSVKVTGADDALITDLSGDGATFYRPTWSPTTAATSLVTSSGYGPYVATGFSTAANSESKHYYVEFNISLQNAGTTAVTVYLNAGTALTGTDVQEVTAGSPTAEETAQQNKNNKAALASRCAILNTDTSTMLSVFSGDSSDTGTYVTTGSGYLYGVNNFVMSSTAPANWHSTTFEAISKTPTVTTGATIAALSKKGGGTDSVNLTVRTWVEGTSTNATDDIVGGQTDLNISFAAVN